jgi:hypothetical protein
VKGLGIRLLVIAIIAGGAFLFRDRITGHAGDLQVGDCFDVPTTAAQEVKDVQHHPCTESHTAEVILVRDFEGDTFPTDAQVESFISTHCLPAFAAYTGRDYDGATELDIGWFSPTQEGWKSGDHEVTCHIMRADGGPMTASVKKAP